MLLCFRLNSPLSYKAVKTPFQLEYTEKTNKQTKQKGIFTKLRVSQVRDAGEVHVVRSGASGKKIFVT